MRRLFDTALERPVAELSPTEQAFCQLVDESHERGDTSRDLDRLQAAFTSISTPSDPLLARLAFVLRRVPDDARIEFWSAARTQHPDRPFVVACHTEALLDAHRTQGTINDADADKYLIERIITGLELFPSVVRAFDGIDDIARQAGEPWWLRYQLADLRAMVDDAIHADADMDGTEIRERYSELLEWYHGDDGAMDTIRSVGEHINTLERTGVLPQVLMRRGDWRS